MISRYNAQKAVQHYLAANFADDVRQGYKLYAVKDEMNTNDVINSIKGPVSFTINSINDDPQWAFFLDMDPTANWEHACAYLLVLASGTVVMEKETAPPTGSLAKQMALLSE